jgi:hypothetical protein
MKLSRSISGSSERYRYGCYEFEIERRLGWFCDYVSAIEDEWPMYVGKWGWSKRSVLRKVGRVREELAGGTW